MVRKLLKSKSTGEKMGIHILAIDDDPEFLTFLRITLKENFTVSTAKNFSEGEDTLKENSVDLVLLDISLGKENGLKLIGKIKQIRPSSDVVIVTGHKDLL